MATNQPSNVAPADAKNLRNLLDRAQRGDESALPAIREFLKEPGQVDAWGDMAAHAEHSLIQKLSGKDLVVREGLRIKAQLLRGELAGPTPTPLERLLVSRIVSCWLHLHNLEYACAAKDSMSLELAMHYEKCIDRAHKRYLSAIKTLAVIRRLALPALQVNIAQKQQVTNA